MSKATTISPASEVLWRYYISFFAKRCRYLPSKKMRKYCFFYRTGQPTYFFIVCINSSIHQCSSQNAVPWPELKEYGITRVELNTSYEQILQKTHRSTKSCKLRCFQLLVLLACSLPGFIGNSPAGSTGNGFNIIYPTETDGAPVIVNGNLPNRFQVV
jgi:hypothetical protein